MLDASGLPGICSSPIDDLPPVEDFCCQIFRPHPRLGHLVLEVCKYILSNNTLLP